MQGIAWPCGGTVEDGELEGKGSCRNAKADTATVAVEEFAFGGLAVLVRKLRRGAEIEGLAQPLAVDFCAAQKIRL